MSDTDGAVGARTRLDELKDHPSQQHADDVELREKTDLLEFTYKEVLDATKHQDDKVGRLLTAISFLTAGALALANLAGGKTVAARFEVQPFRLPVGMFCLTFFLLAVFVTVVLLIASIATPLRLPGHTPATKHRAQNSEGPVQGIKTSQLYFAEIAKVSVNQWKYKWEGSADNLRKERLETLVRETHNLSVRTNFKYDRTTEAIAVFSAALLAFALAVSFTYLATTSDATGEADDPVHLGPVSRLALAAVLLVYAFALLLSRLRYRYQAVDETLPDGEDGAHTRFVGEVIFVFAFPCAVAWNSLYAPGWPPIGLWVTVQILLTIASMLALYMRFVTKDAKGWTIFLPWVRAVWLIPIIVTGSIVAAFLDAHGIQLFASVVAVLLLLFLGALSPTLSMNRYRREFKSERKKAQEAGVAWANRRHISREDQKPG